MKNEHSPTAGGDSPGSFCDVCGEFAVSARPDGRFSRTRCAACGAERDVEVWPLFVVTGASGVGKSTVVDHLRRRLPECLVYDKDWMQAGDWDQAAGNWLRVAHSNARSGRHTVLCGTLIPSHLEHLANRWGVGDILYCNLHCDDELRVHRLRTRRRWQPADDDFIERHRQFAAWLLEHAGEFRPPMPVVDTSRRPPEAVADEVGRWVEGWAAEYARDPRIRFR